MGSRVGASGKGLIILPCHCHALLSLSFNPSMSSEAVQKVECGYVCVIDESDCINGLGFTDVQSRGDHCTVVGGVIFCLLVAWLHIVGRYFEDTIRGDHLFISLPVLPVAPGMIPTVRR